MEKGGLIRELESELFAGNKQILPDYLQLLLWIETRLIGKVSPAFIENLKKLVADQIQIAKEKTADDNIVNTHLSLDRVSQKKWTLFTGSLRTDNIAQAAEEAKQFSAATQKHSFPIDPTQRKRQSANFLLTYETDLLWHPLLNLLCNDLIVVSQGNQRSRHMLSHGKK